MDIEKLLEASKKFGTPLYVYDLNTIEKQYNKLKENLSKIENFKIHFAVKSLSNISVLKYIKLLGAGIDAVSIEEVKICLKCGFSPDEIIYTPNGVDIEEVQEAFSLGVKLNLDSIETIRDFSKIYKNQSITVRINPGIYAGGNDKISVGHNKSKFGLSEDKIPQLLKMEERREIKVTGLHIHTGSDILNNSDFEQGIKKVFSIASIFKNVNTLDLGGGIKVAYFEGDSETDLSAYSKVIKTEVDLFKENEDRILKIIVEPGKFLVSSSGFFLTKVNNIKSSMDQDFVQVNSGFNHLVRPMLYGSHHDIINLSNPDDSLKEYDVVGYICEKDTFAENRLISKISKDDILCFKNAGAYGYSMSSNYNSRLKPAEVCILNGELKKIRNKQDFDDIVKDQIDIFES
ncbi:MAG: diaminopimelate decarboxylase [Bacteroidota bacterium]